MGKYHRPINETHANGLISFFDYGVNGFLSYVLNFIDWTPEVVGELNQLLNHEEKFEFCSPSAEVRHAPVTL